MAAAQGASRHQVREETPGGQTQRNTQRNRISAGQRFGLVSAFTPHMAALSISVMAMAAQRAPG